MNLKKLVYSLESAVSEALEPLVHATSNVVEAFGVSLFHPRRHTGVTHRQHEIDDESE